MLRSACGAIRARQSPTHGEAVPGTSVAALGPFGPDAIAPPPCRPGRVASMPGGGWPSVLVPMLLVLLHPLRRVMCPLPGSHHARGCMCVLLLRACVCRCDVGLAARMPCVAALVLAPAGRLDILRIQNRCRCRSALDHTLPASRRHPRVHRAPLCRFQEGVGRAEAVAEEDAPPLLVWARLAARPKGRQRLCLQLCANLRRRPRALRKMRCTSYGAQGRICGTAPCHNCCNYARASHACKLMCTQRMLWALPAML